MEQVLLSHQGSLSSRASIRLALVTFASLLPFWTLAAPPTKGINLLPAGAFDGVLPTYVPWAGVDGQNNIHGLEGKQLMVGENGGIAPSTFAPSIAVGDMNGDGKNDLILGDSQGYFWYYPNTGTPQKPAFTQGEVIPIWLAEERTSYGTEGSDNVVPRIQLVDFQGSKKLDIVSGTYVGKLFHIPNIGSAAQPNFKPTQNRDTLLINTHKRGVLWCNYLAPFFTSAFGSGNIMDMVMGEGTYSANSIYLLRNTGSTTQPSFDEDHLQKIIPGMGLEQLTPSVVDWNNDGKPDIICGDRTGYVDLFLNNSSDPANPTFAPATHVKIGGIEKLGAAITVTVCDLSGNHLPNLLIGLNTGLILYAVNSGTLGNPLFTTPATPLKGVLPPDYHYTSSTAWLKGQGWGIPYELVGCTSPQLEPGFAFPEGAKSKYALKFWVWPYKNLNFQRYYPAEETFFNEHLIKCQQRLTLKFGKRYHAHFWAMAPDAAVSNFRFYLDPVTSNKEGFQPKFASYNLNPGTTWSEVNQSIQIENDTDPSIAQWNYTVVFRFNGQSTFYLDDLSITEDAD